MEWLVNNWDKVVEIFAYVVTLATAISAVTPTNWDNKVVDFLSKVLNVLAGNVLKNKNADDVK